MSIDKALAMQLLDLQHAIQAVGTRLKRQDTHDDVCCCDVCEAIGILQGTFHVAPTPRTDEPATEPRPFKVGDRIRLLAGHWAVVEGACPAGTVANLEHEDGDGFWCSPIPGYRWGFTFTPCPEYVGKVELVEPAPMPRTDEPVWKWMTPERISELRDQIGAGDSDTACELLDAFETLTVALTTAEAQRDALQAQMDEAYAALPGTEYMDPPDGGDPTLGMMIQRMREHRDGLRAQRDALAETLKAQLAEARVQERERLARALAAHPMGNGFDYDDWMDEFRVALGGER